MTKPRQSRARRDETPNLVRLSSEVYRTRRPRLLRQPDGHDVVILPAPDYEALTEALEVAAGLLRGDADANAGRVASNDDVQKLLKRRIADAAHLSA